MITFKNGPIIQHNSELRPRHDIIHSSFLLVEATILQTLAHNPHFDAWQHPTDQISVFLVFSVLVFSILLLLAAILLGCAVSFVTMADSFFVV